MKPGIFHKLKLSEIITDNLQARAGTDQATIQEYAECMSLGNVFPAIVVFTDGQRYYLADGFHRYSAAHSVGRKDIECTVFEGTRKDALWYAVGANLTHGLKRTHADKRRAVTLALSERPGLSDAAIADHCGVNRHTVTRCRTQLFPPPGSLAQPKDLPPEISSRLSKRQPEPISRVEESQFESPSRLSKRQPESPIQSATSPPEDPVRLSKRQPENSQVLANQQNDISGPETRIGKDGKAYPIRHEPPALNMDRIGRKVPDCCMPIWLRGREVQDQLTLVSRLKGIIRRAQEENDPLYALMNYTTILPHLEQAWTELKTALPYAVCPMCQGHDTTRTTCRLCRGRGLISEFHWDHCVTEEQKQIVLASLKKGN